MDNRFIRAEEVAAELDVSKPYRKCMGREVVVQPNPRVHKALKTQMTAIRAELERIAAGGSVPDELLSTIDLIAVTMQGLKGEDANE